MTRPRIAIPIPTSFDSEYNQRSWPQYASAIERSGGDAVSVPLDQTPAATADLIASCSAILLPGSPADVNPQKYGHPANPASAAPDAARENVDELLLQDAHNMGKPILTICFGTQMLNVWRGGTLHQDLPHTPVNHQPGRTIAEAHPADIPTDTLLGGIVGRQTGTVTAPGSEDEQLRLRLNVNSSHHQAIDTPGDGLRVSARSPQDGIIEAVEGGQGTASTNFILGVQWHPERTYDTSAASRALFDHLVNQAAAWSPRPATTA